MKFKSEEDNIELDVNKKTRQENDDIIFKTLDIISTQVNLVYSILSSITNNIETVKNLYEKHDFE